jgi:hypothetical protein
MASSLRALALPAALVAASCAVEVGPPYHEVVHESTSYGISSSEPLYVNETPPPPREEVIIGVAPGPNHVWAGGYWARRPTGWVWVEGRWAVRPRTGVAWIPGHWERHPRGYVWVPGHWR